MGRNRNVIISHCHIYHNSGVGIYLEGLNLHQISVVGSHISYNRLGGIRIERLGNLLRGGAVDACGSLLLQAELPAGRLDVVAFFAAEGGGDAGVLKDL
ncbi:hypothetical protein BH23VER1_BH23VER1_36100 [soil metagenome]